MAMIYHLAMPDEWAVAEKAGAYTQSTRGLSLGAAGFIHCSRADQWEHIRALLYADVPDVLLLTIDTSRLTSPWQLDPVEDDDYPHIYGPLNLEAVIAVKHLA